MTHLRDIIYVRLLQQRGLLQLWMHASHGVTLPRGACAPHRHRYVILLENVLWIPALGD